MKANQKGFSVAETLIAIAVVVLLGAVGWFVYNHQRDKDSSPQPTAQADRQGQKKAVPGQEVKTNPYEGMRQYSNVKYGISFYYPQDWKIEEVPVDNPSGLTPTEFAINLKGNTTQKYAETASIEIHTKNMQETVKAYEGLYGQSPTANINRRLGTLKGKESVHLTITQPAGDTTEHYLFAVGDMTYSLRSINEQLNIQRSQDYWSNFQKFYDSLELK